LALVISLKPEWMFDVGRQIARLNALLIPEYSIP
jgi:hypothetical protein